MDEHTRSVLDNIFKVVMTHDSDLRVLRELYRSILDNYAVGVILALFENERIVDEIMRLTTVERVIIVFHFALGLGLRDISAIIHSSPESVYAQKSKAIKKMRLSLSAA